MSAVLTLASRSAARRALLSGAGLVFDTADAGVDEAAAKARVLAEGGDPRRVAEVLAAEKAEAVSRRRPGLVLGGDQTLELEGLLLDKAADLAEARARLRALSGRSHQLHSAAAIAQDGRLLWAAAQSVQLHVRPFSEAFLDGYLARNHEAALTSVGAYHLEGEGAQLFERVDGDYFAVLGLPLLPLLAFLRQAGVLPS